MFWILSFEILNVCLKKDYKFGEEYLCPCLY